MMLVLGACSKDQAPVETTSGPDAAEDAAPEQTFDVSVDRFADIEVLRYEVPGFDELSLREKKLAYYLSQAALAGRDIIYDQNYEHNLRIRKLLSAIISTYDGDRDAEDFRKLVEYAKRVWFAHGIHHHYSMDKMLPEFSPEALIAMVAKSDASKLPLDEGQTRGELLDMLRPIMFDPDVAPEKGNAGSRRRPGRQLRNELLCRSHRSRGRAVLRRQGGRGSRTPCFLGP